MKYPSTRKVNQVDDYHGTQVADPYRWLEDVDSPETEAWVDAQNELTFAHLSQIQGREHIRQRLTELWNFPRQHAPHKRGGRYFQLTNSGLQNQDILVTYQDLNEAPRVLLDPNSLSPDGTIALNTWEVSKDGRYLAYATSASGSDWMIWRVRDVESGIDLPDVLHWSKFSGAAWLPDSSGFFYSRYDEPKPDTALEGMNLCQKLYLHRLGEEQVQDTLIYERPDHPDWGFGGSVSEDGRYLIISVWQGTDTRNRIFYQDLQQSGPVVELISELEANYEFVDNEATTFFFRTDLTAPRGKLIAIDTTHPEQNDWQTVIEEGGDTLQSVQMVSHTFVCLYLKDARHALCLYNKNGALIDEVKLPTLGTVSNGLLPGVTGGKEDEAMFFVFSSFVYPPAVFRYDFSQKESQVLFFPSISFDFSDYETHQVFVHSKDGTKIPMFLVHKNDLKLNGQNPTLLYGYGGFNYSLVPAFQVSRLAWLEMGGVLASANLRGGGEYGEEWHQAGMIHQKQNVFDDFIACAKYLIEQGVTSTPRLAIQGGSNGGLLVGACLTQRPDLFGAALPAVGVMDMLRFHKFTIGWAWVSDYGSSDDPDQFQTLYGYSPLHNILPGTTYPPVLVTTADHDDRVVPGHSFKFAATLQAAQAGDAPILIRIQKKAGHGQGKPTSILINELTDIFTFLKGALGMN